ncbi:hypothetical protein K0U27_09850 [archaeon]|nr:hypothetical protein [archaeon]
MIFLDGKLLFSQDDDAELWKQREKISLARKHPIQIDVGDYPPGPQSAPKIVESKVVARIEIRTKSDEDVLFILCYELIEPTRMQVVQDIVKIKQKLLA